MRLLNCRTLKLEPFVDAAPPYAILSHRWREEEILFDDFRPRGPDDRKSGCRELGKEAQEKEGHQKLSLACTQSLADGIDYIWIDTCCIEKSSSAELSEAINSMFVWYRKAALCYAYLFDVPDDFAASENGETDTSSALGNSEWFRRGWTLQELIAPPKIKFYSKGWMEIARKWTHAKLLARITGIDGDVLTGKKPVLRCSVAKRMSWAARRETTRKEDEAYCLMGIFDVNMPMLYGEGAKAFIRLQEEIMKDTEDESLFAWIDKDASDDSIHGLLANSPAHFAESGNIKAYYSPLPRRPFTKTNRGIHVDVPAERKGKNLWEASFICSCPPHNTGLMTIVLKQLDSDLFRGTEGDQFGRTHANKWSKWPLKDRLLYVQPTKSFYVRQSAIHYDRIFQEESRA